MVMRGYGWMMILYNEYGEAGVSFNLIKRRRDDVQARVLYTWLQDGPKIIIIKIIIFRIITLG